MGRLIKIAGVGLVLFVVVLVVASLFIDKVVRVAIERGATHALGTETTVDLVDIGNIARHLEVAGITVANPPGFTAPHFTTIASVRSDISFTSLRQDPMTIPYFGIGGVDMNLERSAKGTNYGAILDHLEQLGGPDDPDKENEGEGPRMVIEEVEIEDVTVHVSLMPEGLPATKLTVSIDRLVLEDLGAEESRKENRGVVLSELVRAITQAILTAAVEQGGDILPADLRGDLDARLGAIKAQVGEVEAQIEGVKSKIDETKDRLDKDPVGTIGDLLKKKGDDGE